MANVDVFLQNRLSGHLAQQQAKHVFSYAANAKEAVSLTMPLRLESYSYSELHPVFQMNLPEGTLRQTLERQFAKVYGSSDLTLLSLLGEHQVGRLRYRQAGLQLQQLATEPASFEQLLQQDSPGLFRQLLQLFGARSGIAGVQPKVLVDVTDKAAVVTRHYIVKTWGPEFPQLACNEYFCLQLCKAAGLHTATSFLGENGHFLISERFDLDNNSNSLGTEDFAVLQGKTVRQKYDASLESCTHTIRQFVSGELQHQALSHFFLLTLLNVLVGNGDAHLKNFAVLYPDLQGFGSQATLPSVRLAPVYDVVSTVAYLPADQMALSLTGSKRWPKADVLKQFGRQHCNLSPNMVGQLFDIAAAAVQQTLPLLDQLTEQHPAFRPVAEIIRGRLVQGF
ncbi:type II toxin-antitoxin system HipA family toxin [Chromatiaceae bacterium AAb-1]|nr:type II toxin-antitoxin system HipA family toxin [Chromatiaceae bacterium AAb-1]